MKKSKAGGEETCRDMQLKTAETSPEHKIKREESRQEGSQAAEQLPVSLFCGIAEKITAAYVLVMLCVFPLYTHDGYYDILRSRFTFFWKGTLAAGCAIFLVGIAAFFYKLYRREGGKEKKKGRDAGECGALLCRRLLLPPEHRMTDLAFLGLILLYLISMALSGYPYETWWGNLGRWMGVLMWLMLFLAYLMITRFYRYKKWHIHAVLFTGLLVCGWGITDFFFRDIFRFFRGVAFEDQLIFTSSIGNINSYTTITAAYFAFASALFVQERKPADSFYLLFCMLISAAACVMGISDNVLLSFGAILACLPLLLWRSRRMLLRSFSVPLSVLSGMCLTAHFSGEGYTTVGSASGSALISLGGKNAAALCMIFLLLFLCIFAAVFHYTRKEADAVFGRRLRIAWGAMLAFCTVFVFYALYDANSGNAARWGGIQELLVFRDSWGTWRGFIWRIAMEYFTKQAGLLERLFGHGPDTYYMITMDNFFQEMTETTGQVFDNAHNEYLNYLMTIGILGLLSYLALLSMMLRRLLRSMLRAGEKDAFAQLSAASALVLCAYAAQASVNLAVPVVLPVPFLLICMGLSGNHAALRNTALRKN